MNESMEEAIVYAKKYLEDLLSFFGLNTDVQATSDETVIQLNVPSTQMNGFLIGQRGENMRSLQYKQQRADRLREKAEEWVKKVKDSKEPMDLEPMNAADRRVIHQLAAEYGLTSESVGEDRDRHIVLKAD
jgi:predicted RNA-binding protein Jag